MTFEPDVRDPNAVEEARQAAEEGARRLPVGLVTIAGAIIAVGLIAFFVLLDYRFDQDPHRLVKILAATAFIVTIVMRPTIGLWMIPIATPFLPWMPQLRIPGVNPLNVLLASVFVSWALSRIATRQPLFRIGRLSWPIAGLLLLAGLSILRGGALPSGFFYDVGASGTELFRSAVTLGVYFVTLSIARGAKERRRLAWALVIGLVLEALVTIAFGRSGRGGRAVGSIGQANELGTFLALYAVLAVAMLGAAKNWAVRAFLAAGSIAAVVATLLSVSRGAIVALGLGVFYVALRTSRVLTLVLVAALLLSPAWAPSYVVDRMLGTQVEVSGVDDVALESSAQLRVDTWRAMVEIISSQWMFGVGFTGLGYILPETGVELGLDVKDSSHNTYLRLLAELGILGLLLFVFLLWRSWKLSVDAVRLASSRMDRQLGVALGAATLVLAISCVFGDRFWPVTVTGNFWILCAVVDDIVLEKRAASA